MTPSEAGLLRRVGVVSVSSTRAPAGRWSIDRSIPIALGLNPIDETNLNTASSGGTPEWAQIDRVGLAFAGDNAGLLSEDLEVVGAGRPLDALGVPMLLGAISSIAV